MVSSDRIYVPIRFGKVLNMGGFDHAVILSSSFLGVPRNVWYNGPPINKNERKLLSLL